MAVVVIVGGIDLSVASMMAVCAVTAAVLMERMAGVPALMIVLAVGLAMGLINGALIGLALCALVMVASNFIAVEAPLRLAIAAGIGVFIAFIGLLSALAGVALLLFTIKVLLPGLAGLAVLLRRPTRGTA